MTYDAILNAKIHRTSLNVYACHLYAFKKKALLHSCQIEMQKKKMKIKTQNQVNMKTTYTHDMKQTVTCGIYISQKIFNSNWNRQTD